MRVLNANLSARARCSTINTFAPTPTAIHGRTAAYRRLSTSPITPRRPVTENTSLIAHPIPSSPLLCLRSDLLPPNTLFQTSSLYARHFHSHPQLYQQAQRQAEDVKRSTPESESTAKEAPGAESNSRGKKPTGEPGSEGEAKNKQASEEESSEKKEEGEKDKEKPKEDLPPPPPHGDKSPWQVFTDTLKTEFKASKEWNESTKALASGMNDFTQNPTVKKARSTYSQVTDAATSKTADVLKTTGKALGHGAAWTWDTPVVKGVRKTVNIAGQGVAMATKPIRETEAYKSVAGNIKQTIDDGSSSRYGGWAEKEERRRKRELRELNELQRAGGKRTTGPMEEDPNAGTNVTLHKDAKWKESWLHFRDSSRVMQSYFNLKSAYQESENPLISTARSISDRFTGFFAENETAMVIKKFREMDPNFQLEPFLTEMREYILPEVLDAYVKGDVETLKLWLSAAQYQVYAALMQQYTTAGLKSDGRILDIRNVDILSARMLEPGEIPVFIITCRTQEVHVYKNAKTNELAAGMDDKVQQVTYAIGVTRIPEDVNNPETRGWRMIELQKSARDYI